jgi:hypothetical protein
MTNIDQLPKFMASVSPYMAKLDDNMVVTIRPISYDEGIIYFCNLKGDIFDLPLNLKIHVYSTVNRGTINETISETDIVLTDSINFLTLNLSNSYNIYYEDCIVLEGGKMINGRLNELGFIFEFPLTGEDLVNYNASRYTSIINADIMKDSDAVKVSSTIGIIAKKLVTGDGIPDFTLVKSVDYDEKIVYLTHPATKTATHITLEFSTHSEPVDEIELFEEGDEEYYEEYEY